MTHKEIKENLFNKIDSTDFTKLDYKLLLNILKNLDPSLFVKIIEEIYSNKSLSTYNFYNVINDENITKEIESYSLSTKKDAFKKFLEEKNIVINENYNFLPEAVSNEELETYYSNILYKALNDTAKTGFTYNLLENLKKDPTRSILGFNNPLFSVNTEDIILNSFDNVFMRENNLSEDEVKKIKALTVYLQKRN